MNNQYKKSFPQMPISFENKVAKTLQMLPEKKGCTMNMFSTKRFCLIAAIVVLLLATTVAALSGDVRSIILRSSRDPNYQTVAQLASIEEDIGIAPKIVESFSNGYSFNGARIVNNRNLDENGADLAQYKELSITYAKEAAQLDISACSSEFMGKFSMEPAASTIIDDIEVQIHTQTAKMVPLDYVMTDEDKANEASGKYSFNTGDGFDTVKTEELTFVSWTDGDIVYLLMAKDTELTHDELFEMVKQIIAVK